MNQLLNGYTVFRSNSYPALEAHLSNLAAGQQPHSLIITCADSRINPHLLFSAAPGEIFLLRSIGNRVPGWDCRDSETAAGIEYAVNVLNVTTVAVLGHSSCGACAAALHPERTPPGLPALQYWAESAAEELSHALSWAEGTASSAGISPAGQTERYNILRQIERLEKYPGIKQKKAAGTLNLLGLYLDLHDSSIRILDRNTGEFHPWLEKKS